MTTRLCAKARPHPSTQSFHATPRVRRQVAFALLGGNAGASMHPDFMLPPGHHESVLELQILKVPELRENEADNMYDLMLYECRQPGAQASELFWGASRCGYWTTRRSSRASRRKVQQCAKATGGVKAFPICYCSSYVHRCHSQAPASITPMASNTQTRRGPHRITGCNLGRRKYAPLSAILTVACGAQDRIPCGCLSAA